jgi:hypothetical protein
MSGLITRGPSNVYSHDRLHRCGPEIGLLLHNPSRKWLLLFWVAFSIDDAVFGSCVLMLSIRPLVVLTYGNAVFVGGKGERGRIFKLLLVCRVMYNDYSTRAATSSDKNGPRDSAYR